MEQELNLHQQAALVRLFSDEEMLDAIEAVCKNTARDYDRRCCESAVQRDPSLAEVVRLANLGSAFGEVGNILKAACLEAIGPEQEEGQ